METAALRVDTLEIAQAVNIRIIRSMIGTLLKTESREAVDEVTHIIGRKARRLTQSVALEMDRILSSEGILDMEGFVTFRMTDTRQKLQQLIESEIREYAVYKVCDNFIAGLRKYVEASAAVSETVHIVPSPEGYRLLTSSNEEIPLIKEGTKPEDALLGTLLEQLPRSIVLHGYSDICGERIIKTIEKIFADKVEICYNC